jgi:caspase domain-containing protein/WD40 domain-containing protein
LPNPLCCISMLGMALLTAWPAPASSQTPSQEPVLQIETGMHIAPIIRIGVNKACRLMVTGSKDKTARVWVLPENGSGEAELLRTLRVPIANGEQGKIYALAMSPNGEFVAAGGWDVFPQEDAPHAVYIFDVRSGALVKRLGDLGGFVRELVFSPDGNNVVATISNRRGIRVWNTRTWSLVAQDQSYGGDSYGAQFDRAGRLYTVAFDGFLRRYDANFALEARVKTVGYNRPFTVAVHPGGEILAVGYDRIPLVEIYRASDLKRLYTPDLAGVKGGDFNAVAWSEDGTRLYAGGKFEVDRARMVRIWDLQAKGKGSNVPVARNTIHQLLPCGSGIAVGAADPAFGLLDQAGVKQVWRESVTIDPREAAVGSNFTLSADGAKVRFGLGIAGERPVLFDLVAGRLVDAPVQPPDLLPPDTRSVNVLDWRDSLTPSIADKKLALQGAEIARSLAIAPGSARFVLGAEWHVRAFTRAGEQQWINANPGGVAWGVNVSKDSRLVAIAYGDGTIRWHRLDDGRELLALFVNAKDRRWVAWTPKGYYMASPGGDDLIGWHVNRGWEEPADFFPVHRFRDQYYRPDVVRKALAVLDEDNAVAEADRLAEVSPGERGVSKLLPPVVEILSHRDGAAFAEPHVTMTFSARSPVGDTITNVDVYLDDAKVTGGAILSADTGTGTRSLDLSLPRRDVKVTLAARAGSKESVRRSVRLVWNGASVEAKKRPRLLALLIGVSVYAIPALKLDYADADALHLASALKAQEGKAFARVEARPLINPDLKGIKEGIKWLEDTARDGDLIMVLLSGHGTTLRNTFYFLGADANPNNPRGTALTSGELVEAIDGLPGGKILLIDACRSGGALVTASRLAAVDVNKLANDLSQPVGAMFFAASGAGEFAEEYESLQGGAFTTALIEGLEGRADLNNDDHIETDEMAVWIRRRVPELTEGRQHPLRHQSAPVEYTMAIRR